jgi:hypothetical protein
LQFAQVGHAKAGGQHRVVPDGGAIRGQLGRGCIRFGNTVTQLFHGLGRPRVQMDVDNRAGIRR